MDNLAKEFNKHLNLRDRVEYLEDMLIEHAEAIRKREDMLKNLVKWTAATERRLQVLGAAVNTNAEILAEHLGTKLNDTGAEEDLR